MSYNMKKMHTDNWSKIIKTAKQNRRKIILNPFYSKKKFISDLYQQQLSKPVNLSSPTSFTEKQNALKLNKKSLKQYHKYADKRLVESYVINKIGPEYIIPKYFCVKKLTISDLKKLPNQFVLKTTNGSGTNYIVEDKHKENLQKIAQYINQLSRLKYGYLWGEFYYNKIKPSILAEKLLLDKKGNIPDDLKCFCFIDNAGTKRKVLYQERVIGDERHRIMFDEHWQPVNYSINNFGKLNISIEKPKNHKKIIEIINKLSENFNFVRVDLLLLDDKIYFGELTFIPTAGYIQFADEQTNKLWGSWVGDNLL